eukprot:6208780-Amphidinium_carterae.3
MDRGVKFTHHIATMLVWLLHCLDVSDFAKGFKETANYMTCLAVRGLADENYAPISNCLLAHSYQLVAWHCLRTACSDSFEQTFLHC